MNLTIENKNKIEIFVALFQLLKNWGSYLKLQFTNEHLFIQTMDQSHVCLSNIKIISTWFTDYQLPNNTPIMASVDCNYFSVILNYALKHQKLLIFLNNSDDRLNIHLLNNKDKKNNFDHFFELNLIDVDSQDFEIPEVEYEAEFSIESKKFHDLISELNVFGSDIFFKCNEDVVELNSSGDSGKLKVNIPIDDLNEYSICEGEEIEISYSLTHISKMCVSTKLGNEILISISRDYPMSIKYDLGDNSFVRFYIAPKIID